LFITSLVGTLVLQGGQASAQAANLRFQVQKNAACTTSVNSGDTVNIKITRGSGTGTINNLTVRVNGVNVGASPTAINGPVTNLQISSPSLTTNPSNITVAGQNVNQGNAIVNFTAYCEATGANYGTTWSVATVTTPPPPPPVTVNTTPCTTTAWFQQGNFGTASKMSYLNLSQSSATVTDSGAGFTAQLNGSGYNKSDSYFYGFTPDSSYGTAGTLWQFDSQGNSRNMGIPLPKVTYSEGWFAGDVRGSGIPGQDNYLYVAQLNVNKIYKISLAPNVTPATSRVVGTITTSRTTRLNDVAFSPLDGNLYGFDQNSGVFVRINPSTGAVTNISQAYPANAHGVAWFYQTGTGTAFYSYDNNGYIYRITGIESYGSGNLLPVQSYWKTATSTQQNDGSVCATPPGGQICIAPDGNQYPLGDSRCNPPPPDVCPNIAGSQTTVPAGYVQNTAGDCVIPATPYLRVYGNDVAVGSAFGASCNIRDADANIRANARSVTSTTWAGASGQFALLALGQIDGFYSANLRNPPAVPPNPRVGLTFGNFSGTSGSSQVGDYGGLGGQRYCMQDFFSKATSITTGNPTIGTTTVAQGTRTATFVRGNVYINGTGITFQNSGSWTTIAQIPSYYLVVEGNIYIDPSVTQLDGIYIAQPQIVNGVMTPNTGRILTCTNSSGASLGTIAACANTLTVNGAFIAHQVRFQRTNGNSAAASDTENASNTSNLAEVFKFSPETYLAVPPVNFQTNQSLKKYDFITSLPPVL
jgi:hypothetical protein